ncbi:hypothetical protein ACI797_18505 [Geodermatophilus sp. SYSU D00691]
MVEDAARRRAEQSERAAHHAQAQRRREQEESDEAQVLIDRSVEQVQQMGLPTEELTARPWSGVGRHSTGVVGWYLKRYCSVGIDTDGRLHVLNVPPVQFGRWRTAHVHPAPPAGRR